MKHIIAGAAIGALIVVATTLVMVFQPGIVDDESVSIRDLVTVNLGIGIPLCVVLGGVLGWLWHAWLSHGR